MAIQRDPCAVYPPKSLVASVEELNRHSEWFTDRSRPPEDSVGPYLIVVDDFYGDPFEIRRLALSQEFVQYAPPLAEYVGEEVAARYRATHPELDGSWLATALKIWLGTEVLKPVRGFRYNPEALLLRMAQIVGEQIERDTWDTMGDWWNGAFHLIDAGWKSGDGSVHHHYKEFDVSPRGWSGLIYLSPDALPSSGTSIWRDKKTGLCVATYGATFRSNVADFDLALLVENKFNRLVLFRENVLHRAEHGFGRGKDARLTQTFFFCSTR